MWSWLCILHSRALLHEVAIVPMLIKQLHHQFSQLHVLALHRLTNHLDHPPRTKLKSLWKKVLEFRGMALPKPAGLLVVLLYLLIVASSLLYNSFEIYN